jgi:hypothetical protein
VIQRCCLAVWAAGGVRPSVRGRGVSPGQQPQLQVAGHQLDAAECCQVLQLGQVHEGAAAACVGRDTAQHSTAQQGSGHGTVSRVALTTELQSADPLTPRQASRSGLARAPISVRLRRSAVVVRPYRLRIVKSLPAFVKLLRPARLRRPGDSTITTSSNTVVRD